MAENGKSMAGYADKPVVIAKHKFHIDDFFLYYPLPDKSWRPTPNQLDTVPVTWQSKAIYAPENTWEIYFSGQDADGIRNIYMTEKEDTLWTYPALLNENLTSASNEIYPMLSPDGKSLYFASEGLFGMGGYDLYVSRWDNETQDWGAPVNMGFPYSSPADDMLLVNTADGEYTIFASNRDCSADSVWVYVLEFDSMPVRHAVEDPAELRKLASLDPVGANERMDGTATVNGGGNIFAGSFRQRLQKLVILQAVIAVQARAGSPFRAGFRRFPWQTAPNSRHTSVAYPRWRAWPADRFAGHFPARAS